MTSHALAGNELVLVKFDMILLDAAAEEVTLELLRS